MIRVRTVLSGWEGGPGLMTHYFNTTGTPLSDAQTAVDRVRAALAAGGRMWGNGVSLQVSGDVDALDPATGNVTDTYSVVQPASFTNSGTSDPMAPPALALLAKLTTNTFIAGRRVRGRSFISPTSNASIGTGGVPTAFHVGVVNAYLGALFPGAPGTVQGVVWHRPNLTSVGQAAPISSFSVGTKFAVLTSRRD